MRRMLAVLLLAAASAAAAQEPTPRDTLAQGTPAVAFAADIGPAFPLGEFSDNGAQIGWTVGGAATLRLTRLLGLYVAVERSAFDIEPDGGGASSTWTDRGIGVGVNVWFPRRRPSRLHPWARLGIGWHDVDPPPAGPAFAGMGDGIRTLDGGAGIDIAIRGPVLYLRPMVRYRRYTFEVATETETLESTVSSIGVGLGIVVSLAGGDDEDRDRPPARAATPGP